MAGAPPPEDLPVAVRAYAVPVKEKPPWDGEPPKSIGPSAFTLTFDTETFSDAAQQIRIGAYQWREDGELLRAGVFYDPASVTPEETATIAAWSAEHGFAEPLTDRVFVEEVFFGLAYDLNATIVGFNLPFDLSRLAFKHGSARGNMRGGFTLHLSEDEDRPNVRVKHLSSRSALISFQAKRPQRTARSIRKKKRKVPVRRGYFVDARTAAGALLGVSRSLRSLGGLLGTPTPKAPEADFAGEIDSAYLDYATTDVQVTWECYERLAARWAGYGLKKTFLSSIYSEASVGKACLREMGVERWRKVQPAFPPEVIGIIMSTYYGGRSEVHLRRLIARVLYLDFHAQYPSLFVLMNLWRFVSAAGIESGDVTAEARAFLESVTLEDLQRQETWADLHMLVQVQPLNDLFPVRTKYQTVTSDGEVITDPQYTTGLNYLTSGEPMWFTLADCVVSKLLTGSAPEVVRAIGFWPLAEQTGLRPIDLLGRPDSRIDPQRQDPFRRMIELREATKQAAGEAESGGEEDLATRLRTEEQALKITANASTYGIYVEMNVDAKDKLRELTCYGGLDEPFTAWSRNVEKPGSYFHPVLSTIITGAGRLLLGIAEHLADREDIGWAFCDTDSMALARPKGMPEAEFLERAERVRAWFDQLNPVGTGPLFEVEDVNRPLVRGGPAPDGLAELFGLAVSAKRHCLFTLDVWRRTLIRKASAHGLGHLIAPYPDGASPRSIPKPTVMLEDLGVERWEYDLWHRIVKAALAGDAARVKTKDLPGFNRPAVARYAATTPHLLSWFKTWNRRRVNYRDQVRPFGFLLAYQADPSKTLDDGTLPHVLSPYYEDLEVAIARCFDRETGRPVGPSELRTYRRALAQYHLNPETKFRGADYLDAGITERRYVQVAGAADVLHIGKEANRWEEQFFLGFDPEAQVSYGRSTSEYARLRDEVLRGCEPFRVVEIARAAGLPNHSVVSDLLRGSTNPDVETWKRLRDALPALETARRHRDESDRVLLERLQERIAKDGLRSFASAIGVDHGNLSAVRSCRRSLTRAMRSKLRTALG
jgi:hypothetical protein